ncbi:MAG TPA: BACON domain-containing carbohydrate-binding protein [Blastocatellia bacterium]|nr:BACON domain-containing carbohydrate-binding protein [Blastocatellia bacterium]
MKISTMQRQRLAARPPFSLTRPAGAVTLTWLLAAVLVALLHMAWQTRAITYAAPTGTAFLSSSASVHPSSMTGSSINLSAGHDLLTTYSGGTTHAQAIQQGTARPRALATADFDEDGVADLVCGYAEGDGGLLVLHRGNADSIYADSVKAAERTPGASFGIAPFVSPARLATVSEAADFLSVGDFDADGHWDAVTAMRGGQTLNFLMGDGAGGFRAARQIALPGRITAMIAGDVNRRDGLDDLVVAVSSADGPQALIYESPRGAFRAVPEMFALPDEATALALGRFDDDAATDIAVAAGRALLVIYGRDRRLSLDAEARARVADATLQRRALPSTIRALTVGDFTGNHIDDLAALTGDGLLHLFSRDGNADTQSPTPALARWQSRVTEVGAEVTQLLRARLSSDAADSLLMIAPQARQLRVFQGGPRPASAATGQTMLASLDVDADVAAVLPMRLNADALNDLVIFKSAANPLAIVQTQAQATFTVTNTEDAGAGSLRQAILDANANPGADTIRFQIPGSGVPTIAPLSPLPDLTEAITIDGTTQPAGRVELNGAQIPFPDPAPDGRLAIGLRIKGGNSLVRGLVINRFQWRKVQNNSVTSAGGCIYLAEQGHNIIEGNLIGTDASATTWLSTPISIITYPGSPDNLIGGTTASARNVILGYVHLLYDGGNTVQGNYLGTNRDGSAALTGKEPLSGTPFGSGVTLGSANNLVGGTTAGARNIIAGTAGMADGLAGPGTPAFPHYTFGNLIQGNYIGTDATGTVALDGGVRIQDCPNNTIGGTTPAARNLISGSQRAGILVLSSEDTAGGTLIQGNYIGTDPSGALPVGNNLAGASPNEFDPYRPGRGGVCINVESAHFEITRTGEDFMVGGAIAEARNVIAASLTHGVVITGAVSQAPGRIGVRIEGNYIGTDAGGARPLGNHADGIFIGSQSAQCKIANNLIAFNGGNGINVPEPPAASPGKRITITANAIYSNQLLGIDLGMAGVTDNDAADADAGANDLQNFPVLASATATAASVTISGSLSTAANATCTLQFFYGSDRQGHQLTGSAPLLLGEKQVTTDSSGNASFSLSLAAPAGLVSGWVTATATDAAGNTSEFADCVRLEKSNCIFTLALTGQSFKAAGGSSSVNVTAESNCNWTAASLVDWITITAGSASQGNGTVNYSVAAYNGHAPRTGTLRIAEQIMTVVQAGTDPVITDVSIAGKNLIVRGESFDSGAVILINGERQKTLHDLDDLTTLSGKKLAKKLTPGQMVNVQVRNSNDAVSAAFTFTRPGN